MGQGTPVHTLPPPAGLLGVILHNCLEFCQGRSLQRYSLLENGLRSGCGVSSGPAGVAV